MATASTQSATVGEVWGHSPVVTLLLVWRDGLSAILRYLVTIDCTCLAPPRTLYRKSMTICEIEVSCPVSIAAAAAVELPHR